MATLDEVHVDDFTKSLLLTDKPYKPEERPEVQAALNPKYRYSEYQDAIIRKHPPYYEAIINVAHTAYHYARSPQDELEALAVGWRNISEYSYYHPQKFILWLQRNLELYDLFDKFAKIKTKDKAEANDKE